MVRPSGVGVMRGTAVPTGKPEPARPAKTEQVTDGCADVSVSRGRSEACVLLKSKGTSGSRVAMWLTKLFRSR